jgi:hypothetical protein
MAKRISDESVIKSTGKSWNEWFSLLNKSGAKKMEHNKVARLLHSKYDLSAWWSQMVTVQYEQEIKGRKKHETTSGYQISKSKTLAYSLSKTFNAVLSSAKRKVWLKDPEFKITTSTKNKSIHGKWIDGQTNIEFQFYSKDKSKTQVVVQLSKIRTLAEAERMKKYWGKNLNYLEYKLSKSEV